MTGINNFVGIQVYCYNVYNFVKKIKSLKIAENLFLIKLLSIYVGLKECYSAFGAK